MKAKPPTRPDYHRGMNDEIFIMIGGRKYRVVDKDLTVTEDRNPAAAERNGFILTFDIFNVGVHIEAERTDAE